MVLPAIPLIVGAVSAAAGALGLKKGFDAKKVFEEAREIGENAQRRYKRRIDELNKKRTSVNQELESLGEFKKKAFVDTLGYVVQQLKNARSSVAGFDEQITCIDTKEVDIFDKELTEISALDISTGAAQGLTAGTAGAFGAYGTVGLLASASTGTAISSLSGAAATNATLAWLGGGSLASGGLGIAGGTWVLGGLVAGPALAIAGYALASKAEEALTKAEEYKAEVKQAIAELESPTLLLDAIQSNIDDTRYVIQELLQRFADARHDYENHLKKENGWRKWLVKILGKGYQNRLNQQRDKRLANLVAFGKSIKAVISEPLLDSTGAATQGFNARIAGVVQVESIEEKKKSCIHCAKQISAITRICPECHESQDTPPKEAEAEADVPSSAGRMPYISRVAASTDVSPSTGSGKFMIASISGIAVLSAAFGYWYFANGSEKMPIEQSEPITIPATPVQEKAPLIDTIVQTKTLGMSLQYFETLAGPAKYVAEDNRERTYEIEGCEIKTILSSGEQKRIEALNIKMSPTCNAKVAGFLPDETNKVLLSSLTIRQITDSLQSHPDFSANCLMSCGNAYDPSVYASWTAARFLDFLEVKADVLLVESEPIEASHKWAESMAKTEGEEWVIENQFNCNPNKYQNTAWQLFADIKPTSITFGKSGHKPDCPKQEQVTNLSTTKNL